MSGHGGTRPARRRGEVASEDCRRSRKREEGWAPENPCALEELIVKAEQILPRIRHWTAVYVDDDTQPTYRGTLFWHEPGVSIVVNGAPSKDSDAITTTRRPVPISRIREIAVLDDPPWLVESNKAAAFLRAKRLVSDDPRP